MEITIRKADAADLDAVVRVYEHVHDAEEAGPAQVASAYCWRQRTCPNAG